MPKIKPFAELPARLQKKIRVDGPNEVVHHWRWLGAVTPASHKVPYAKPGTIHRLEERALQYRRAKPNVWSKEHGFPVPAYRKVWCEATGADYATMPEITRCSDDLCVSPHHILTRGPHRVAPEVDIRPAIVPPKESTEEIWNRLITLKPNPDLSLQSAADEVNLTSIPEELWAQYSTWCIDNYEYPEEDD